MFAYALLAALLSVAALAEPDDWSWKDDGESQQFTAEDAQVAATSFSEPAIANATDLDEVIDSILTRQGRNLEEFDEVYTDPNVQEALQKGDDGEARNLIREKLCGLGLMQCDGIQGKRPYIAPEDLVYAQPVAINPVGRPIPTIPLKGGPIRGGYGPPKPMPFPPGPPPFKYGPHKPHGPPRREFGPPKTYYPNRPFQSSGSGSYSESSSFESSRPPFGNIQSEFPYEIESSSFGHKDKKPVEVIVNAQGGTATGASGVQQHVHHHFHHGDEKIPAVVVSPVASGVAGGNFIQSSGFKPSPSLSFGGYKENGFSSGSSESSILGGSGSYGSSGLTSGSFGSSGLNSGSFGSSGLNSGSFGVNSGSFGVNSGSFGVNSGSFGVNSASFGLNSKPSLTIGGGGSGIYGGQSTASYGGSTGLGTYGGPKPISESYGPQTFGSSLYTNSIGASVGSYGSSDFYKKELNLNGGVQSNSLQSGYGDKFQGFESARNENYDCVCVPYDQCPSHEVIGRKDDQSLPLDPRSLKTDIEAEDERVVTDGNGTMTIVRVTKEAPVTPTDVAKTGEVKKVKREAAAEKKEDKTQTDGRQLGDFTKNIKPTFGVSFGLPNQGGGGSPYPNPLGPPHYADPYLNNGINLGLVSVNPLVSVQVTKNDYGEKVVKPFVNLHVTPNHFLIHKVKDFFDYKKGQIFNKHEHYHHHLAQKPHYDRPHYYSEHGPPEYYEDDHHRPHYHQPQPQYHQSPQYHQPPQYHQHQHQHHGGYYDDSFNYGGGGGGFEQFDDDYYGRSALNYTNGKDLPGQYQNQYDDQNYYAQSQDSYGNPVNYEQGYSRQGKDLQLSSPVRFPTSRKRRDLNETQKTKPDTQIEKRQAYYGGGGGFGRPPTCGPRHVCCRRPIRPNVPTSSAIRQCGTRHSQGINGRIKNPVYVDGDSEFGEYPWQVAILKKDPKESVYVCGGTLIDPLHILTAAHCVKSYTAYDIRVRLGEWDVNHDVEFYPYVERDVSRVDVHPEFYTGTLYNDIAILRMDKPVDFSRHPHIGPACLPSPREDYTGARCWTTGWGKDAFGDFGKYQNILKETDVPIVGNELCQRQLQQTRLGYDFKLHPGFVCAGGEEGKDACKGDGGGPMVCERGGSWNVVGVVSWGIGCGQIGVPGVYVKVAHYLDWIRQVTQRF